MNILYEIKGDSFEIVIDEKSFKSKDGFIELPDSKIIDPFIEKGILKKIKEVKSKKTEEKFKPKKKIKKKK